MSDFLSLKAYLESWASDVASRQAVADTVSRLAAACRRIADLVGAGPLTGTDDMMRGHNGDGGRQSELDLRADAILIESLRGAPVAWIISEESNDPIESDPTQPLIVAVDPLDGFSNIDTNVSVGTIFSISPVSASSNGSARSRLLRRGNCQSAAGYVIYGPQTALVLSVGEGAHVFTLNRNSGEYLRTRKDVRVPRDTREFAINVSNFHHWDTPIRTYINDCLDGKTGIREDSFNMRWIASLVADCHRILSRGGIYLYPGDSRAGYAHGRLRLVYEANPIAFLIEQAGGSVTTGMERILDVEPDSIHQRIPLIFGSCNEVERVARLCIDPHPVGERSPLFEDNRLLLN